MWLADRNALLGHTRTAYRIMTAPDLRGRNLGRLLMARRCNGWPPATTATAWSFLAVWMAGRWWPMVGRDPGGFGRPQRDPVAQGRFGEREP